MASLPTMPRLSWSERCFTVLAGALAAMGAAALAGWFLHIDPLVQFPPHAAPVKANVALAALVFGGVLLAVGAGRRRAVWIAALPAALALLTLVEQISGRNLGLDEWLAPDAFLRDSAAPGRMSSMVAGCLLLAGFTLGWRILPPARGVRARLFTGAITGSIIASVGFSTLLGYSAGLPAVYRWGTLTATAPLDAVALLLLGLALLALNWGESRRLTGGPPAWAALPGIIACLTLTTILWAGLRDREFAYLGTGTEIAINSLATRADLELARQKNAVEHLAQSWSQGADNATAIWELDAADHLRDSPACVSVAWIDPSFHTRWIYPYAGNENAVGFDHPHDPGSGAVRAAALEAARRAGGAVVSGSLDLPRRGRGFVIYCPVRRGRAVAGYVAAEYPYQGFFGLLDHELRLSANYSIAISVAGDVVYRTLLADARHDNEQTLDSLVTIADRHIRFTLTPSAEFLARNRRSLPEFALFAGLGLTLLLGLSVHFARTAQSGRLSAEQSNRRLIAENEERRRIEARLKISDERLRLALDSTQIGIFEWNIPAAHVYYSPGLWAMLGYEHARMPCTVEAWQSFIHPDDLPAYRRLIDEQLGGARTFIDPEYRVRARDGDWRWVYTRAKAVGSAGGAPTRIVGTVHDITARREAEEALRASQAAARKLSLVAARTDNLVLICTPAGRVEWANESFTRIMEYPLDEVVGRNAVDFLVGPETSAPSLAQIQAALERGHGGSSDVVNRSKSGRKYHLQLELQPVRGNDDVLENFIIMLADITARVETEHALRVAKAEADDASRAKSEFLASMSHEIRTPMNAVIGMTSLLLETGLTAEQRDFANTIRSSGEALLTIINDILDFSKIESGKLELEQLPFDLAVCLEETFELFAMQASAKKLDLAYLLEPGVPPWIVGDVTRLRQVLVNLVNNAVKFTPSGGISIEVRRVSPLSELKGITTLEFTVRDTGIGIAADRLNRLFKVFSQVDSSTTRKYGGTGLGLAISQRLCTLMGGAIRAESTVGVGSAFVFTMQAAAADLPAEGLLPPLPAALQLGAVLVAEPSPTTRRRLQQFFAQWGVACHVFATAAEAAAAGGKLDAAPRLLLGRHEDAGAFAGFVSPRIFLLPFGRPPPARTPGPLTTHVALPLKTAALAHAIVTLFQEASRPPVEERAPAGRLLAEEIPLNVLLAEDNPVNQKVALRFMARLGYRVDAVGNGLEALTAVEARKYDLVLMDLQMPEMDGLEASRQIRRRVPPARQPKIVALTANAMQGDRETCLEAGMDDYISKPVKLHEIEEAIRRQFAPEPRKIEFIG